MRLGTEVVNLIRLEARRYSIEKGLSFYDARNNTGFLRNMILRSTTMGDLMLIMVYQNDEPDVIFPMLDHFMQVRRDRIPVLLEQRVNPPGPEVVRINADTLQEARGAIRGQCVIKVKYQGNHIGHRVNPPVVDVQIVATIPALFLDAKLLDDLTPFLAVPVHITLHLGRRRHLEHHALFGQIFCQHAVGPHFLHRRL